MRFDGKENPQEITNLSLKKLSNVTRPAHGPALAQIIKSDDDAAVKGAFRDIMEAIEIDQDIDRLWDMHHILRDALFCIWHDTTLDENDRRAKMQETISEYLNAVATITHGMAKAEADDELFKSDEFLNAVKHIDPVTGQWKKQDKEQDKMSKELQTKVDGLQKALDRAEAIVKMTAAERTFFDGIDNTDGQEAFIIADTTTRQALIDSAAAAEAAIKAADEVVIVGETEIKKSVVGDSVFVTIKAQQEQIKADAEKLAKAEAEKVRAELVKEAGEMFTNLAGSDDEKADILEVVRTMDDAKQARTIEMLKAASVAMKGITTEEGHTDTNVEKNAGKSDIEKADAKLDTLAKAHQKDNPGLTKAQAYKAVLNTPEGQEIYNS